MSNKEYNRGYQSGYFAGLEAARREAAQQDTDLATFGLAELSLILTRHEGYTRLGHSAQSGFWARYKWSAGAHEGFYTFGGHPEISSALAAMCERVHQVEQGKLKPTPDRPAWKR